MAPVADSFDLGRLRLSSGEGYAGEFEVHLPGFELGGEPYEVLPAPLPVRLEVSRPTTGWALLLRFDATVRGPCMRCLGQAERSVVVDAREVDQPGGGAELESPYLHDDVLELAAWARDALRLALPEQILCSDECRGLCAVCGADLNQADSGEHEHGGGGDERWAKLRNLEL